MKEVIFPDTLITLESGTFGGSYNIEKVVFSKSLSVINGNNWSGNSKLKEVIIPEGITTIGGSAFGGCSSLEKVKLPSTITTIEGTAFSSCQSLKEIKIPDSVTNIGSSAFAGCVGIKYIYVPHSVTSLGGGAFSGIEYIDITDHPKFKNINNCIVDSETMLGIVETSKEITIPEIVKVIADNSLGGCINNILLIPDYITEMYSGSFGFIETLIIGEGITTIPRLCFNSNQCLKHIVLGSNVTSIEYRAFYNLSAIETITCKAINAPTIDSYTFY